MPNYIGRMPVLWTLQRYIFREMGRTFILTAVSLTGILGLGGGVLEMVRLGEVSPDQLWRLLLLVLPVAAALTLPVAALFSAAATYGRLSADNEFVACRSSGINLYVLFLPAIALSLLSATVTFAFSNYVIPGMVRNLNEFIHGDITSVIRQRLTRPKGISFGGRIRLSAKRNSVVETDPGRITIEGIRFLELDGETWVRYGTARQAEFEFLEINDQPRLRGTLYGLSLYDRDPPRFFEEDVRVFPTQTIPSLLPRDLKFLNLQELIDLWRHPEQWHRVQTELNRLRLALGRKQLIQELWRQWERTGCFELRDQHRTITLTPARATLMPGDVGIELFDVQMDYVADHGARGGTAKRVVIDIRKGDTLAESGIGVEAFDVHLSDGSDVIERPKESFPSVALPEDAVRTALRAPDRALFEAAAGLPESDPVAARQQRAVAVRGETVRDIVIHLNERFAFSMSVVVLVVLGAALGIVFRGAHVIIAFGISFVPSLLIIVGIVTGKQMAKNDPTYALGLTVMWGVIVGVAVLDTWVMTRVLRR